jgi:ubiquinone biosynthesis protein COQ4
MASTSSPRTRPLVALRALIALNADPDDLPQVFTIIDSLPFRAPERMMARMRKSDVGRRLLADKPDLGRRLRDRDALRALPDGSLGRAYLELVEKVGITPEGIVDASVAGKTRTEDLSEDMRWLGERMRDTHDLWHAVTGYGTDLVGESALLAFTYAQTKNKGIGVIVALAYARGDRKIWRTLTDGYRRGRRAEWLPGVEWEALLDRPLEEVRARLGIGAPAEYEPVTSADLRENGYLTARTAA